MPEFKALQFKVLDATGRFHTIIFEAQEGEMPFISINGDRELITKRLDLVVSQMMQELKKEGE